MITKENKRWNMRNGDSIKISILQQGGVKIGGNHIQMISSNLAAIYISLGTKHGSIEASYSGGGDACGLSLNILYNKEFTTTETDDVPDTIIQFDDLGFELPKSFWGSKSDVMADVLFSIYRKNQMKGNYSWFHFTSNLSGERF